MKALFDILKNLKSFSDIQKTRKLTEEENTLRTQKEADFIKLFKEQSETDINTFINTRDENGYTLIYLASFYGLNKATAELLERGADPNIPSKAGATPLMNVIEKEHLNIFNLLMAHKNLKISEHPKYKDNPFHYAALKDPDKYLLPLLAKFPLAMFPNSHFFIRENVDKRNALMMLIQAGKLETFEKLYNLKWFKDEFSKNNFLFFYVATYDKTGRIFQFLLNRLFLDKGFNINLRDEHRATVLHRAVLAGNIEVIKILLTIPTINIHAVDNVGFSPITYARDAKRNDIVELLNNFSTPHKEEPSPAPLQFSNPSEKTEEEAALDLKTINDIALIKMAGHILAYSGEVYVFKNKEILKIRSVGNFSYETLNFLTNELKKFPGEEKIEDEDKKIHEEIVNAYEASRQYAKADEAASKRNEAMINHFKAGKFAILPVNWPKHAVGVALHNNHLIFCNRGAGQPTGLLIYTLNEQQKAKITAAWLQKLMPVGMTPTNEQVLTVLNEVVDMRRPQLNIPITKQEVGNCSYENLLGLYKALHLLKKLDLLNKKLITDLSPLEYNESLKNSTKKSNRVLTFLRTNVIHELVKQAKQYNIQEENRQVNLSKNATDYREIYVDITRNIIGRLSAKWPKRKPHKIEQDLERIAMLLENLGNEFRRQSLHSLELRRSMAPDLISKALAFKKEKLAFLIVDSDPDTLIHQLPDELRNQYKAIKKAAVLRP